jgi:hypothetical protein
MEALRESLFLGSCPIFYFHLTAKKFALSPYVPSTEGLD